MDNEDIFSETGVSPPELDEYVCIKPTKQIECLKYLLSKGGEATILEVSIALCMSVDKAMELIYEMEQDYILSDDGSPYIAVISRDGRVREVASDEEFARWLDEDINYFRE